MFTYEAETDVFDQPSKNSKIIFKIPFGSKIKARKIPNDKNWIFSYNNDGYIESKKTVTHLSNYKRKYSILRKSYSDCWCYSSLFEIETKLKLSSNKVYYYYKANVEYQEETGSSTGSYNIVNNHLIIQIPKYIAEICYPSKNKCEKEVYPELEYDLMWNNNAKGFLDPSQSNYFSASYLFLNTNECIIQPNYTEGSNSCSEYCNNPKENENRALFDGYYCSK
ncbi:hypothetical protein CH361_18595 [Leptospira brenneri]|nr:hypothetical protein CH361_18595 [Leptospira brenneri]